MPNEVIWNSGTHEKDGKFNPLAVIQSSWLSVHAHWDQSTHFWLLFLISWVPYYYWCFSLQSLHQLGAQDFSVSMILSQNRGSSDKQRSRCCGRYWLQTDEPLQIFVGQNSAISAPLREFLYSWRAMLLPKNDRKTADNLRRLLEAEAGDHVQAQSEECGT